MGLPRKPWGAEINMLLARGLKGEIFSKEQILRGAVTPTARKDGEALLTKATNATETKAALCVVLGLKPDQCGKPLNDMLDRWTRPLIEAKAGELEEEAQKLLDKAQSLKASL